MILIIIIIYLVALILGLIVQFFSPWWLQLIMMAGNFAVPDFIPFADEIAQALILAKTIKSTYSKTKTANKVYKIGKNTVIKVSQIFKIILIGSILSLFSFCIFYFTSKNNQIKKNIFYQSDVTKINIPKEDLYEFGITQDWISENSMYDETNKKYSFNDIQILNLVKKMVIEEKKENFLKLFSKEELAIIRNTIFAEKGFSFKVGGKYRTYFEGKSWYKPFIESQDTIEINENEKKLIFLIKKYENNK